MKAKRVALALDHLLNVLFNGRPGQTVSGRAETARRQGRRWGCVLCAMLDWLDDNHCAEALEGDIRRANEVINDSIGGAKK